MHTDISPAHAPTGQDHYLTKKQAALLLGVSPGTIDYWRRHHGFPEGTRVTERAHPRWLRSVLLQWMASRGGVTA